MENSRFCPRSLSQVFVPLPRPVVWSKLDIKTGELGALALTGVYEVPKTSGAAFAAGAEVGWDAANRKAVVSGAAGSVKMGHAVAQADAADQTVFVRLCQGIA